MVDSTVNRLRELAASFPRPDCSWEEQPDFDPPSSGAQLAAYEAAAGFTLPADLRAFLTQVGAIVALSVGVGCWIGGIEQLLRSIGRGDFPRTIEGARAIPIATDGAGNAFLMTADGQVWRWDHETDKTMKVATSFSEYLSQVVDEWAAYIAK
jgi:cell wall assembly regulator SMI1